MSVDSLIFWSFVLAWIVVLALIFAVYVPRAIRDAIRLVRRTVALVGDSPLPLELSKAGGHADRIVLALERLAPLLARANVALGRIRTTPVVPASVAAAVRSVRFELAELGRVLRRR